jgi:cytidyltransferase-like protein
MRAVDAIQQKIMVADQMVHLAASWRIRGKKIAFTNGCFDILHEGHIFSLSSAAREASLLIVDAVVIFNESTPLELITKLQPDVLVKGGDYQPEQIVGASEVMSWGGRVVINPLVEGFSTTGLIQRIKSALS